MENTKREITAKQLDKLNHCLAAFESGRPIDQEYYNRFAALAESVDSFITAGMFVGIPAFHKDTMQKCATAAKAGDSKTLCEILPPFCDMVQSKLEESRDQKAENKELMALLQELKDALIKKENTDNILARIASLKLDSDNCDLFLNIYNLMLLDNSDEALERIEEWLKS